MRSVNVYYARSNSRSKIVAQAMARGIRTVSSDMVELIASVDYRGVNSDVAVFYGLSEGLSKVMEDYTREARAVHVDLGYWSRRIYSRYDGYHKITVNSRHPDLYFQNRRHNRNRFMNLGLHIKPWAKEGKHILIAGMSEKAAIAEGLRPEQWEKDAIKMLASLTDRPIIYRPKPNWSGARPIPGSTLQRNVELVDALVDCHAVVTHHSNVAVDAILAGVPAFCFRGAATPMSITDLSKIESPFRPNNREQWAYDLAYCQWTTAEMSAGLPWKHLKSEGLV